MTPMISAINDAVQDVPLENSWDGLGYFILGLLLLSLTISFLTIYLFTRNLKYGVLGSIIGLIVSFLITAIPINSQGDNIQYLINVTGGNAAIFYYIIMTTIIGLIATYIKKILKNN